MEKQFTKCKTPKVYNSLVFSIFTRFHNHHNYLIPEHCHHSRKKPHTYQQSLPTSHRSPPHPSSSCPCPATSNLLFMPILDIFYKWNHIYTMWCSRTLFGSQKLTPGTFSALIVLVSPVKWCLCQNGREKSQMKEKESTLMPLQGNI